ncbi:response regulator receiver domain protein (CheY-like) [Pseudoalteromonas luteoviolacea B = ATCC 29581]|nr:response regulator receiver domain protein (CheY-like) [Pseudoalteromonas luteoviolacea B = ATCC 29581]
MNKLTCLTILFSSFLSTFSTHANLVANGSFEQSASFSGKWSLLSDLPGWQRDGAKFEIQTSSLGIIDAQAGSQYLELDSTANYTAHQTIATVVGQKYQLTFYYTPRVKNNNDTNKMTVTWNDQEVITLNGDERGWQKVELTIIATSTTSKIAFTGTGKSDSYGALIDNVSLVAKASKPACLTGLFGINEYGSPSEGYVYHFNTDKKDYSIMANLTNTASNLAAGNGKLYFMEQLDSETKETRIWQYSLEKNSQAQLSTTTSFPIYRSTIRDDKQAIRATSLTYMYDFDLHSGEKTVLGKMAFKGENFKHGDIAYSADGNILYVLTGQALYTIDIGTMELTEIGKHGVNWASGIAINNDGEIFVSGRNPQENAKIYRLDPQTATPSFVMDGPSHINDLAFSSDQCN